MHTAFIRHRHQIVLVLNLALKVIINSSMCIIIWVRTLMEGVKLNIWLDKQCVSVILMRTVGNACLHLFTWLVNECECFLYAVFRKSWWWCLCVTLCLSLTSSCGWRWPVVPSTAPVMNAWVSAMPTVVGVLWREGKTTCFLKPADGDLVIKFSTSFLGLLN